MAGVRILLVLVCAASVKSQLLPADLLSLLPLGGKSPAPEILNALGQILNLGLNTVDGITQTVKGTLPLPGRPVNVGYRNPLQPGRPDIRPDGDKNAPSEPVADASGYFYQVAKLNDRLEPSAPMSGYSKYRDYSPYSVRADMKVPESNVRFEPDTLPQNGVARIPITLSPGSGFQSNNVYAPGWNMGSPGFNVLPNFEVPKTFTDSLGRVYYVIPNQVSTTQTPMYQNPLDNLVYVLLNVNGQQLLVPLSSLYQNGLQDTPKFIPNPGHNYVQPNVQNPITNRPANPIVDYVTGSSNSNDEATTEVSGIIEGIKISLGNNYKINNTKDVSE